MIFLQYEPINPAKAIVTMRHFLPLDLTHGLRGTDGIVFRTQDAILEAFSNSLFVESIPVPQPEQGYIETGLFINPQTGLLWYEYVETHKTKEEDEIARLRADLDATSAAVDFLLMNSMI